MGFEKVQHIFVLMFENRAFDHMLGRSAISGTDSRTGQRTSIQVAQTSTPLPNDPASCVLDSDPGHEFENVLMQLCGMRGDTAPHHPDLTTGGYPPIVHLPNGDVDPAGFVASYQRNPHAPAQPNEVLRSHPQDQLPVLNALAREFAICDVWFSSLPGPTWPNRFFVHAASSGGLDDSPSSLDMGEDFLVGYSFPKGSIFDLLDRNQIAWKIFAGDEFPISAALKGMVQARLEGKVVPYANFESQIGDPNYAPGYTFLEPNYGKFWSDFSGGQSQHPKDSVRGGEELLKDVYEKLRKSPLWGSSALIVTYDEHGGFYDHMAPPPAPPPNDGSPAGKNFAFRFDQYGVRVPALVISPLIPRNVIDHILHDHAAILATVERRFGLPPLTDRDGSARDLSHLFTLDNPRGDCPTSLPSPACVPLPAAPAAPPVADLTSNAWGFLQIAAMRHAAMVPGDKNDLLNKVKEIVAGGNAADALGYVSGVNDFLADAGKAVSDLSNKIQGDMQA